MNELQWSYFVLWPLWIALNEYPQDRALTYYPRIGEDLFDFAKEKGMDAFNFDLSALSVDEIIDINITGICVKGML